MAEYIEREALIRKIKCFAADVIFRGCKVIMTEEESCNPVEWTKGYEQGVKDTANLIAGQPAADVVEVPQEYACYTDFDDENYLVHLTIPISEKQFKALGECADLWKTLRMDGE